MPPQDIPGQERAIGILRSAMRSGRLSHAYLFSGPAGTGKRRAAEWFAQALFCETLVDDACGQCLECRKIAHGNHPGLHFIEPDGTSVKIDQIRELQRDFAVRADTGKPHVYIISQAERMTAEAANSLLKFLEEPSSGTIAVLLSDNGGALLPTLQSRCQRIAFLPVSPETVRETLIREGAAPELAAAAAHVAGGLHGARNYIQLPAFAEIRNIVVQLMKEGAGRAGAASLLIQQRIVKGGLAEHAETVLDLCLLWFKDMVNIQAGRADRLVFADEREWLTRHAFSKDVRYWIRCIEAAIDAKRKLRAHVQPQLALEQLMIRVQGG